jgi:hypothetical protein
MYAIFKLSLTVLIACILWGCNNPSNDYLELEKENKALRQEIDSLKKIISVADTVKVDTHSKAAVSQKPSISPKNSTLKTGRHDFTLQWISWDEPGSVDIQAAEDGWYSIEGGQKSSKNSDYITINGLIKQVSASELLFKGEIKSVIQSNNGGQPCIKTGNQVFKTTKNRKYWRLQDMINCEGGMLTDYVDIYF